MFDSVPDDKFTKAINCSFSRSNNTLGLINDVVTISQRMDSLQLARIVGDWSQSIGSNKLQQLRQLFSLMLNGVAVRIAFASQIC